MNATIRDLAGEARQWAEQEIQQAVRSGDPQLGGAVLLGDREVFGVAVTWVIIAAPNQAGEAAQVPMWFLAVTHRSPLPGAPPMTHCKEVGAPEPHEATVRAQARAAVGGLRALWRSQLATGNGAGPGPGQQRG